MSPRWRAVAARGLLPAGLFLGLCLLLLFANWPWPRHFATGFARHWDPPFHAWKLVLAARAVQAGHLLPPGGNSNCFFPSSFTFFYEALHWPQAAFAAAILRFTDNPILAYHATLLAFWAFSGVCFFWLLRELRLERPTAVLGAVVFCVLPYRMFYFVEFNMQLCAGLVLSLLTGLRFFTKRGFWNGVAFGLAFWFQASSELYQALIFTLLAPFLFASFLTRRDPWRDRRFWQGVAGFAATLPLTLHFLYGYAILHDREGMGRDLSEISHHILEPLSFLAPPGGHGFFHRRIRTDETCFNPTLPVFALALAYAWVGRKRTPADTLPSRFHPRRWRTVAGLEALAMLVLLDLCAEGFGKASEAVFNLSALAFLASVLTVQLARPPETDERRMIAGLGSAAGVAFLFSLGPQVSLGNGLHFPNWLFDGAYATVPLLSGMRVVSRFAFIVDLFLLVAAMAAWDLLRQRWKPLDGLAPLLPLAVLLSQPLGKLAFEPFDWAPDGPAIAAARAEGHPVLFLPFGGRDHDSRNMLAVGRHDLPMLYGWGGFYPYFQNLLAHNLRTGHAEALASHVGEIWPDARILIDKHLVAALDERDHNQKASRFTADLAARCVTLADDADHRLLAIPAPTNALLRCAQQTRRDLLDRHPFVRLTAYGTVPGQRLCLRVNGAWAAELALEDHERTFVFEVPPELRLRVHPTRVEAISPDGTPWTAREFLFSDQPPQGGDVAVTPSAPPKSWPAALDQPPEVPAQAIPADIRFANGLRLLAIDPPTTGQAGDTVTLRTYWSAAQDSKKGGNLVVFLHAKAGRDLCFQNDQALLPFVPDGDIRCQPYRKVFTQDLPLEIPAGTLPGTYALEFGLWQPGGKRIDGRTTLPAHRRTFRLPAGLRVGPPAGTLRETAMEAPARPVGRPSGQILLPA